MASVDLIEQTADKEYKSKQMLNAIERELVETTEVGCTAILL